MVKFIKKAVLVYNLLESSNVVEALACSILTMMNEDINPYGIYDLSEISEILKESYSANGDIYKMSVNDFAKQYNIVTGGNSILFLKFYKEFFNEIS